MVGYKVPNSKLGFSVGFSLMDGASVGAAVSVLSESVKLESRDRGETDTGEKSLVVDDVIGREE